MNGEPHPHLDREFEGAVRLWRESLAFRLIVRAGDSAARALSGSDLLGRARAQADAFNRLAPPVRRRAVGWGLLFAVLTNGALLLVLAGPLGYATLGVPLLTAVAAVVLIVTGRTAAVDSSE